MKLPLWSLFFISVLSACVASPAQPDIDHTDAPNVPFSTSVSESSQFQFPARLLPAETPPAGVERDFSTDFSRHTVPYREVISGGPPKDGIPAINQPVYVSVAEADAWLESREPVIWIDVDGESRAYPIQILMWHEIVNDSLNGLPLAVTFCPLCNTAIAFERKFKGQTLDFGTTGWLRYSNLIMYDRQSETWWQQASGEAIAGRWAGEYLVYYPAVIISWAEFKSRFPDGSVLSRETGYNRSYGVNPYAGYDDFDRPPFLYDGPPTPQDLLPMSRVLTVEWNGEAVAYPYDILSEQRVINDEIGGQPVVIFWQAGVVSPLDSGLVSNGADVGSAAAFSRRLDGKTLTFAWAQSIIHDLETGSQWDYLGNGLAGEFANRRLTELVSINHFWFSWAAFRPDTRIYQP